MSLDIEAGLKEKFPGLGAILLRVEGVEVRRELSVLEAFKGEVYERTRDAWTLDQLREQPVFRAYRDFFWRVGVDPTKTRPAAEALIRRVLRGRPIPKINTFVDSYNLASIVSTIPLAAFDLDGLSGGLLMREAMEGEEFVGIAMEKPIILGGGETVVEDGEKLVAIYPYRDADESKITLDTENVLLMVCGVPNIIGDTLKDASRIALEYVTRFCGGSRA